MKISYNTLKQFVSFDHSPEALGVLLTNTGLEVEGIEKIEAIKGGLEGIVIGEVLSCIKHPDADKLSLTKVLVGDNQVLDIVCGAPNVAAGQKVLTALVGATLYPSTGEPFVIKKSKIRGEVSKGMLCAEDELGLGSSHAGIMVLNTDLPTGTPAIQYFDLAPDFQIEIGLTPNRADAASHYGVARDIKAVLNEPIKLPNIEGFATGNALNTIQLDVQNTEACPRFCGLEIQNVKVTDSPDWLKAFLGTIGVNSINNLVDITNYICHYLGQPMHIFDADKIEGHKIVVRTAIANEKLTTLDGTERALTGKELAICNASSPMAIAGVFGGKESGVSSTTKNVFLEVAYFDPSWIRRASNIHGLKTDASFRYERGTDPEMPIFAIKLAALMVQQLAGGKLCANILDHYPSPIKPSIVDLRLSNIDRLIGKKLGLDLVKKILVSLDIEIKGETDTHLHLSVPSYRVDVTREADVIEEILRIYGFDSVEESEYLNSDFLSFFPEKEPEVQVFNLASRLTTLGFNEIQNLSITKPGHNAWLAAEPVKLMNALSEELSEMRNSLLFQGLESLSYNFNRRAKDLKFFEFGRTYHKTQKDDQFQYSEKKVLAFWITGNVKSESWQQKSQATTFWQIHQTVHDLLDIMRCKVHEVDEITDNRFSICVEGKLNSKTLFKYGILNKEVLKYADLKQEVFYAEFDWDLLLKNYKLTYAFVELPKYPEVRRDLSIVIDKSLGLKEIKKIALGVENKLITGINVFDVYEGEKMEAGKKSYSVSFTLLDPTKTLNDTIIDKTMNKLIDAFEKNLNAVIRR